MDSYTVLLTVVGGIVIICLVYDTVYLESLKDVHELALKEQSSISSTRKTGESAIYRSMDVMHGLPLTFGLQIRHGIYKVRNGNLKDIWKLALENYNEDRKLSYFDGKDKTLKSFNFKELNVNFQKLAAKFKELSSMPIIGIYLPVGRIESLSIILTCFFFDGFTLKNFNKIPLRKPLDVELICCLKSDLPKFVELSFKKIIIVDDGKDGNDENDYELNTNDIFLVHYSDIINNSALQVSSLSYDYTYSEEEDFRIPLIEDINFKDIQYYQLNFVSTIASLMASVPREHSWNEEDIMLIGCNEFDTILPSQSSVLTNQNLIVKILCAFVSTINNIIVIPESQISFQTITDLNPTLLCLTESKYHSLLNQEIKPMLSSSTGLIRKQFFHRSALLFSRGIYSQFGSLINSDVRICYSCNLLSEEALSTADINILQTAFGSRFIVETFKIPVLGPILKTNFYDYRILSNEIDNVNKKLKFRKMGVAANCLELKVKDFKNFQSENKEGELVIRGFNIGTAIESNDVQKNNTDEGWMPIGIYGKWGEDGCFYEYL
ncbi:hypothetical protein PACTADRAFT_3716 [Pachysolen tannophilus NRRL Y-2460]|uniref:AMP-dependent synthetase/ligase domain-containing protein n=1 Tax=Pachysolen tannophilus NRRL Y-2460 TaxID=669874 RepID=A0A1E4TSV9_PACTA|nr:hypothetical protein PACTADRAFT_3716 [Pachysolen tannophilus NRRL Y-2460]